MRHKDLSAGDLHSPTQEMVENDSGSTIVAYRCVTFTGIGATGLPTIELADPGETNGITVVDILDGEVSYVMSYGFFHDLDTSAWTVGTALYCDPTTSELTDVSSGPQIARVISQHATEGIILVTCLETPAASSITVADTDSIDLTLGADLTADLKISSAAASTNYEKAVTTVKTAPNAGLHIEYPHATGSVNGILKSADWTTFNNKVAKAGDTMTGYLTLHADPSNVLHAATKQYVDGAFDADGEGIELSSGTFSLELDGTTLSKSSSGLKVANLGITDAQIAAAAAITRSKIAVGTANRLIYNHGTTGALTDLAAITANRALISDANGLPTHSSVTNTELGYVSGVTSAIQTQIDSKVAKGGDTMTGLLTLSGDPSNPLHAATKQYVDAVATGLNIKLAVRAATTADITLSGAQTIDDVSVIAGQRVLVKDQTDPEDNGIYVVAAGAWSRSTDMDTWSEVPSAFVFVQEGTLYADTGWVCTADIGGTLGTTDITWTQFSGAGTYTADGVGIELSGTQFSLELDGTTLSKSGSGLKVADLGIANAQIAAAAAIARSKIATGTANRLVYNADTTGALADLAAITANRALISDANGLPTHSSVTNTELGYVSGVTSAIQTQINAKVAKAGDTMTGFLTLNADPSSALHAATKQYVDNAYTADGEGIELSSGEFSLELDGSTLSKSSSGLKVADLGIANAQIAAAAAIARSKIATGSTNRLVYNDGSTGALADLTAITASRALVSDTNGLPVAATTTTTEVNFLAGIGSATTLPIAKGGTNSGTTLNNNRIMQSSGGAIVEAAGITASRALISDSNGIPTHSSVTSTELGHVSGVTSAIQTQIDGKLSLGGGTMTGNITLVGDASSALHPVTKQQFDAAIFGLDAKASVKAATTANITLSGAQTIDGVSIVATDRVLVKNQSTASENGIYIAAAGSWTRATDFDVWTEVPGAIIPVEAGGTANGGTVWLSTSATSGTIGSTNVTFSQISGPGTYTTDGQGIEISGTQFALELDGTTLSKSATGLKVADLGIANAQISASAAIARSKIATGTANRLVYNADTTGALADLAAITASRALASDSNGLPTASATTATELGFVSGVTSAIQTQLNARVVGPGSSVDNSIARYDLTTGKIIQGSGVIISDADAVSGITQLNVDNLRLDGNVFSSTDTNGNITFTPNGTGVVESNAQIQVKSAKTLRYYNSGNTFYGEMTQTAFTANRTFNLPDLASFGDFVGTTAAQDISGKTSIAVDNLLLDGNTLSITNSNGGMILTPNGTGAFQLGGGGNARGARAVDLQLLRVSDTSVASGGGTFLVGFNNKASGDNSCVVGGTNNNATIDVATVLGGGSSNATGIFSTIVGGIFAAASGYTSTVIGGTGAAASHQYSVALGGAPATGQDYGFVIGNANATTGARANVHFEVDGSNSDVHVGRQTDQSAVASASNKLKLHTVNASNQSKYVSISAPTNLTSNIDITCPATTGTMAVEVTGTFTATLTGCTTSPTVTAKYVKQGNAVTLYIPALTGTSNATTCTITGMPSTIFPTSATQRMVAETTNSGVAAAGLWSITSAGVLELYSNVAGAAFTASGTKGVSQGQTVTYLLT